MNKIFSLPSSNLFSAKTFGLISISLLQCVSASETPHPNDELAGNKFRLTVGRALYSITYQASPSSELKTKKAGINSVAIGTDLNNYFKFNWPVIINTSLEWSQSDKSAVSDDGTVSQVYIRYNGLLGIDYPFAKKFKAGVTLGYGKAGQQVLALNQNTSSLWGFSALYQAQCSYQYPLPYGQIGAQLAFRKDLVNFTSIPYANSTFSQINQQGIQTRLNLFYGF